VKKKNGVKLIPHCNCGLVKPFDEWQKPNAEAKKQMQEQRQDGVIKFIHSVCPKCLEKR